jgi:hypothetical protein
VALELLSFSATVRDRVDVLTSTVKGHHWQRHVKSPEPVTSVKQSHHPIRVKLFSLSDIRSSTSVIRRIGLNLQLLKIRQHVLICRPINGTAGKV